MWTKLDEDLEDDPKILPLSDRGFRAHVTSLTYASKHLTDGYLPSQWAAKWGRAVVAEMLTTFPGCDGPLWITAERGYRIRNYLIHNPSRAEIMAKREARAIAGAIGGAKRWAKQVPSSTDSSSHDKSHDNGDSKRIARDRDRSKTLADKSAREADPLFDAVAKACEINPSELTDSARGAMNRALKSLRAVAAKPAEIPARATSYRQRFPDTTLTPTALAKHWPTLGQPKFAETPTFDRSKV